MASYFVIVRIRQPLIIGEILVGIAISLVMTATGIQLVEKDLDGVIGTLARLGSIILLFSIGLQCDLRKIYTKRNFLIATGGVILPWITGFALFVLLMPSAPLSEAIFVGTILVATSVAVTASVLAELKMISNPVGTAILGAAVVDDILGMVALAMTKSVITGSATPTDIILLILAAAAFIGLGIWLGVRYLCRAIDIVQDRGSKRGLNHVGFIMAFAIALLYCFVAEIIGVSAIVGAFIAGTVFASLEHKTEFAVGMQYLGVIFIPVFFVTAGIMFEITGLFDILILTLIITAAAVVTKLIGCGIPARLTGMTNSQSFAVGIGMAPRLEVAMVIAIYGLQNGIINNDVYSMAIFVGLATALITPSLLKWALKRMERTEAVEEAKEEKASPEV